MFTKQGAKKVGWTSEDVQSMFDEIADQEFGTRAKDLNDQQWEKMVLDVVTTFIEAYEDQNGVIKGDYKAKLKKAVPFFMDYFGTGWMMGDPSSQKTIDAYLAGTLLDSNKEENDLYTEDEQRDYGLFLTVKGYNSMHDGVDLPEVPDKKFLELFAEIDGNSQKYGSLGRIRKSDLIYSFQQGHTHDGSVSLKSELDRKIQKDVQGKKYKLKLPDNVTVLVSDRLYKSIMKEGKDFRVSNFLAK